MESTLDLQLQAHGRVNRVPSLPARFKQQPLHAARAPLSTVAASRLLPGTRVPLKSVLLCQFELLGLSWTLLAPDHYSITPIPSQSTAVSSIHLADSLIHLLTSPSLACIRLFGTNISLVEWLGSLVVGTSLLAAHWPEFILEVSSLISRCRLACSDNSRSSTRFFSCPSASSSL